MPSGAWTLFATTLTLATGNKTKQRSPVEQKIFGPYDVTNPQRRNPDNPLPRLPGDRPPF
jgi:hypothetical protein